MSIKSNCSKHTDQITGFGSDMEKLAEEIGDLRYDTMFELFRHLSSKIGKDSIKDREGGRKHLADALAQLSTRLALCTHDTSRIWDICKPYMEEKND